MKKLFFLLLTLTVLSDDSFAQTIWGQVTLGATGNPAYPATVYIIAKRAVDPLNNDYDIQIVDSADTDPQGNYTVNYPAFLWEEVMVKGFLQPSCPDYTDYLPTYHGNSLLWSGAITFTSAPVAAADIQLIAGLNPGGPAFIAGLVSQGANKSTDAGDPLPAKLLILTDMSNTPVSFATSDAQGHFSFDNVAYGTYKLFGESTWKTNPYLLVTVDATHTSVSNIVFQENDESFWGEFESPTGVSNVAAENTIASYPSPFSNEIAINGMEKIKGEKQVTVYNAIGAIVYTQKIAEGNPVKLSVANLNSGYYFINVRTNDNTFVIKAVK